MDCASPVLLQARCAGRNKDRLPATRQIHPRPLPPSALHWKSSSSLAWSRRDSKYGPPPCKVRALLSLVFAVVQNCLQNRVYASGSICVYSPLFTWVRVLLVKMSLSEHHGSRHSTFSAAVKDAPQDPNRERRTRSPRSSVVPRTSGTSHLPELQGFGCRKSLLCPLRTSLYHSGCSTSAYLLEGGVGAIQARWAPQSGRGDPPGGQAPPAKG